MNKETRVMLVLFAVGLQVAQLQCHCRPGYVLETGLASGSEWQGGCSPSNVTDCTCDNGIVVGDEIMRRLVCEQSGGQACSQCDNGYRFESFGCVPYDVCPNGTPDAALLSCAACDVGYQLNSGKCTACREYENYQDGACHSIYKSCGPGKQSNGTACIDCPDGQYKATTHAGRCEPHRSLSEVTCVAGMFIDLTSNTTTQDLSCAICPDGTYQTDNNATSCIEHNSTAIPCSGNGQTLTPQTKIQPQTCEDAIAFASAIAVNDALTLTNNPDATVNPEPSSSTTNNMAIGIGIGSVIGAAALGAGLLACRKSKGGESSNSLSDEAVNVLYGPVPDKMDLIF